MKALLVPLCMVLAFPALAQAGDDAAFEAEIERQVRIDEAVIAVDGLVGALLDMPVGALAGALPAETLGGARARDGDTLRDLGTRHDPNFEESIRGGARAMTAVIGNMMQRLETNLPALEQWAEETRDRSPD